MCVCRYSATVYLPRVPRLWSSCDRMCFHVSRLCVRCGAVRRVPSVRMWRGNVTRLCGRVFPGALHSCFDEPWPFTCVGVGSLLVTWTLCVWYQSVSRHYLGIYDCHGCALLLQPHLSSHVGATFLWLTQVVSQASSADFVLLGCRHLVVSSHQPKVAGTM